MFDETKYNVLVALQNCACIISGLSEGNIRSQKKSGNYHAKRLSVQYRGEKTMHWHFKFLGLIFLFSNLAYCHDSILAPEQGSLWTGSPSSLQQLNESSYNKVMGQVWKQYNDDFNYSSLVLDGFVKKNMSANEAFMSTISLYVLNERTINTFKLITPPQTYSQNHNLSLSALINLEDFFWYMAKYYQTQEKVYAVYARDKFNESRYYYNQVNA